MKLVLATNNMGKVREFARILEPLGISLLTQQQAGVQVQPEENGTTFAENARIKAMAVYQATGLPTIADDSGLCIDALDGQPGVYSARYYGEAILREIELLCQICRDPFKHRSSLLSLTRCKVAPLSSLYHTDFFRKVKRNFFRGVPAVILKSLSAL